MMTYRGRRAGSLKPEKEIFATSERQPLEVNAHAGMTLHTEAVTAIRIRKHSQIHRTMRLVTRGSAGKALARDDVVVVGMDRVPPGRVVGGVAAQTDVGVALAQDRLPGRTMLCVAVDAEDRLMARALVGRRIAGPWQR